MIDNIHIYNYLNTFCFHISYFHFFFLSKNNITKKAYTVKKNIVNFTIKMLAANLPNNPCKIYIVL